MLEPIPQRQLINQYRAQGKALAGSQALGRYLSMHIKDALDMLIQVFQRQRSEEHTSELQSRFELVCRLLLEKKNKNQAVATSQEAVQNQNEPQLRDENAHNDKSVHGVLNPTYQAGLRRDDVQPDIEAERKKRDEIEAGKSYCSRRFGVFFFYYYADHRDLHSFPTRRSSD